MKSPRLTKQDRERWAEICELCFGDGLTPTEIAERINSYSSVVSTILERVMFHKVVNDMTIKDVKIITKKSKV